MKPFAQTLRVWIWWKLFGRIKSGGRLYPRRANVPVAVPLGAMAWLEALGWL
jgi:hypothetical protein